MKIYDMDQYDLNSVLNRKRKRKCVQNTEFSLRRTMTDEVCKDKSWNLKRHVKSGRVYGNDVHMKTEVVEID